MPTIAEPCERMPPVALHPEGVDRNIEMQTICVGVYKTSPSTRRAWIEIAGQNAEVITAAVALHPEGVDRNFASGWSSCLGLVALHPEGVDRNDTRFLNRSGEMGRPPPGGRG